jgi:hypothetical protein
MNCGKNLDDRIDPELLALAQGATQMIPTPFGERFSSGRDEFGLPTEFYLLWTAYLAAAMFANARGVVGLLVHDYGIQAITLERQGYEILKRLEFYVNHQDLARLEYLAWPWRSKKLLDELQMDNSSSQYQEVVKAIEACKKRFPDVEAYAIKNKCCERSLADMVGTSNDTNAAREYAFRYRLPSQVAHLSVSGTEHFLRSDGTPSQVIINFSSTILDPNRVLEQLSSTVIRVLDILDQALNAGCWPQIVHLDQQLNEIMKRLHPERAYILESRTGLAP